MPWRHRLRTIFVCVMLEYAAMFGAAMRPEQVEELFRTMNRPALAHVSPDESDRGDNDERNERVN
jgi:hypothetical protein